MARMGQGQMAIQCNIQGSDIRLVTDALAYYCPIVLGRVESH